MQKIPPPTPVPDTLDWDLWLGGAASRPFTAGDEEYQKFVAERNARGGAAACAASARQNIGFYLPFNWRGFYDFGSSLIGDWGVHILGPANWASATQPGVPDQRGMHQEGFAPALHFSRRAGASNTSLAARPGMPPVTVYWYHHAGGDAYLPPGMTAEEARKIPETGLKLARPRGQAGFGSPGRSGRQGGPRGEGGRAGTTAEGASPSPARRRPAEELRAAKARQAGRRGGPPGGGAGPRGSGYNCIFVGSKGYLGTNGRGEGVGLLPGSTLGRVQIAAGLPGAFAGRKHGR